jgi:REP element-mobilizing transposase RayT
MDADEHREFLITFRTYGTWLHGDARGSVDRRRNHPGEDRIPAVPEWEAYERRQMKDPPVILSRVQRSAVREGFRQEAREKAWSLYCFAVQTNHVHVVIGLPGSGDGRRAMNALKSAGTRMLHRTNCMAHQDRIWARGGSVEALRTPEAVQRACRYVIEQQGTELADVGPDMG